VLLRLYIGSLIGILGLGLMGTSLFPLHWGSLLAGCFCLAAGLALTIGLMARRPPPS
jgi:hypothetical protein